MHIGRRGRRDLLIFADYVTRRVPINIVCRCPRYTFPFQRHLIRATDRGRNHRGIRCQRHFGFCRQRALTPGVQCGDAVKIDSAIRHAGVHQAGCAHVQMNIRRGDLTLSIPIHAIADGAVHCLPTQGDLLVTTQHRRQARGFRTQGHLQRSRGHFPAFVSCGHQIKIAFALAQWAVHERWRHPRQFVISCRHVATSIPVHMISSRTFRQTPAQRHLALAYRCDFGAWCIGRQRHGDLRSQITFATVIACGHAIIIFAAVAQRFMGPLDVLGRDFFVTRRHVAGGIPVNRVEVAGRHRVPTQRHTLVATLRGRQHRHVRRHHDVNFRRQRTFATNIFCRQAIVIRHAITQICVRPRKCHACDLIVGNTDIATRVPVQRVTLRADDRRPLQGDLARRFVKLGDHRHSRTQRSSQLA